MDSVVSIRLDKETKMTLEHDGIDIEDEIITFLSMKAAQIDLRNTIARLTITVRTKVKPSKKGFAVRSIRSHRYTVRD